MESVLKLFLAVALALTCLYSMNTFGFSLWFPAFMLLSIVLVASIFIPGLRLLAWAAGCLVGVCSLLGLALLLLAGTIGGEFNLSESNELVALGLVIISLLGCSLFLFKEASPKA